MSDEERDGKPSLLAESTGIFSYRVGLIPLTFIADIALARVYGPIGKGALAILRDTPGALALLAGGGLGLSVNYHAHRDPDRLFRLFVTALVGVATVGLLIVLALFKNLWSLRESLFAGLPEAVDIALAVAIVTVPVEAAFLLCTWLVISGGKPIAAAEMRFLRRAFFLVGIGAAVTWAPVLATGLTWILGIQLITLVGCVIFALRRIRFSWSGVDGAWRSLYWRGLVSGPLQLAERMQLRLGIILLGTFALGAEAGIFSVAASVANLLVLVATSTSTALFGRAVSDEGDLHAIVLRLMFPAAIVASLIVGVAGHWIIPVLWGRDFAESSLALIALLPGAAAFTMIHVVTPMLVQRGVSGQLSLAHLAGLGVNVAVGVWLIPSMGAVGAAVSTSASALITGAIALTLVQRLRGVSWLRLVLPRGSDMERAARAMRHVIKRD